MKNSTAISLAKLRIDEIKVLCFDNACEHNWKQHFTYIREVTDLFLNSEAVYHILIFDNILPSEDLISVNKHQEGS